MSIYYVHLNDFIEEYPEDAVHVDDGKDDRLPHVRVPVVHRILQDLAGTLGLRLLRVGICG